jgi:hypothetical protein
MTAINSLACGAPHRRIASPIRTLAVAATGNGRLAPEPAAGAGVVSALAHGSYACGAGRSGGVIGLGCVRPPAGERPDLGQHPSPIASPIRPPAVAATDEGRRAPELAAGIGVRDAPAMLLGCSLRRSEGGGARDGHAPCGFSARRGVASGTPARVRQC